MEHTVALSDASEPEEDYDELDSDGSFNDNFNSDDHSEESGLGDEPEKSENLKPGSIHPYHSCSSCRFIEFDSEVFSLGCSWAKMKVRTPLSDGREDCEFFHMCTEQGVDILDSGIIYIYVELKDGRYFPGSKIIFNFEREVKTLPEESFLAGSAHLGPGEFCNCTSAPFRRQPSAELFESAQRQITECMNKHRLCPKRDRSFTPLRLIHICSANHIVLYSSEPQQELKYAVLSYCWGGSQNCETRKSNFADRTSLGMPIKELSKTLQEAVEVTKKLGLKYLWADCLCIIQDSTNDKEEQITQMPDIYAAAEVTIAASCAGNTSEGFLRPKAPRERLFRFSSDLFKDIFVLVQNRGYTDSQPLDTRAWALQETVLSIRILNFTTQAVRYECGTSVLNIDTTNSPNHQSIPSLRRLGRNLLCQVERAVIKDKEWSLLAEEYTKRKLSFPEDRLLAISGLAARFAPILKSNYLAGLWESQLPLGLLWRCTVSQPRPSIERAPSWSWVSVDGPVSYDTQLDSGEKHETMELHSVSILPQRMDSRYGSVRSGGLICVSSLIKPVTVIGQRDQCSLVDTKTGASLRAKVYFDTVDDGRTMEDDVVYAFNYYKAEGLLLRQAARGLYTVGLLLTHVSGRSYRRMGIYDAGRSTDWFINSNLETIYIV